MRQAVQGVVRDAGREHLHLILQPSKGPGVNDAVAVAMKFVAVRVRGFGKAAPTSSLHRKRETGKQRAGECLHFGRSESARRTCWLTCARSLPRKGSSSLRALPPSVGAIRCASAMLAASLATITVGWSIT